MTEAENGLNQEEEGSLANDSQSSLPNIQLGKSDTNLCPKILFQMAWGESRHWCILIVP